MAVEEVGVRLLTENSDRFNRDIKEAQRYLNSFIGSIESGAGEIAGGMKSSERAVEKFTDSTVENFKKVDGASEVLIGAFRRVGEMAVNLAMDAGQALVGFAMDSVSVAGDYQATLNKFSAVTGDSLAAAGMDVEDFSDLFLQMGMDTAFSAQEAAEAAVELAKGGIAPATIAAGGLESALSLAAVGQLDLATSGEILAKQLGVWATKGVTAGQVTDLLAQAANASTVDVDELANGLANVQGRAAAMGMEYEDLIQTMAVIAPGFESASTAGTSLNNFLARLIPVSDSAKKGMSDLGLVAADGSSLFYDAAGSFVGMEEATRLLQEGMAGLTEEEKSFALQLAFGNDAMGAAIALAESGPAGFNAMGASMAQQGSAADQARELNQGWNFSIDQLMGSIETGQIQTIMPFLDTMAKYVDRVTEATNATFTWLDSILTADDPLNALVASVDSALPGFSGWLDTLGRLPSRIIETGNALREKFAPEIQLAQAILETAMTVIDKIVASVLETVQGAIDKFTANLNTNSTTWRNLLQAFEGLWVALEPIILGALAALGAAALAFLGAITGVFTGILNAAEPFAATLTAVLNSLSIVFAGIAELVMGFSDLVVSIAQLNAEGILQAFQRMENGVLTIFTGLVAGIVSAVGGLVITVLAFIQGLYEGVTGFFQSLYDDLVGNSIIPELVEDILVWFARLPERALAIIGGMVDDVKNLFTDTDWGAVGRGIIDGITNGLTSAATSLATAARDAARDAYNAVTDFLLMDSPSKLFFGVGLNTMDSTALGVDEGAPRLIAAMESVFSALAVDVPQMLAPAIADTAPAQGGPTTINNSYNYEAPTYAMNVRTQESVGTIGNTVKALQAISRIRGR